MISDQKLFRVIVCGSRDWTNAHLIESVLGKFSKGTLIISGAAPGADTIAARVARKLGFVVVEYPAKWKEYGRPAGPRRNSEMLKLLPDLVVAFRSTPNSKGTNDMIEKAQRAGVETLVYSPAGTLESV